MKHGHRTYLETYTTRAIRPTFEFQERVDFDRAKIASERTKICRCRYLALFSAASHDFGIATLLNYERK